LGVRRRRRRGYRERRGRRGRSGRRERRGRREVGTVDYARSLL